MKIYTIQFLSPKINLHYFNWFQTIKSSNPKTTKYSVDELNACLMVDLYVAICLKMFIWGLKYLFIFDFVSGSHQKMGMC